MRLEIADTLPAAPRDLAKLGRERRKKLMGAPPQFPKPIRLNPPRPITVMADPVVFNNGRTGWTFGQYQFVAAKRVNFDFSRVTIHQIARLVADFFGLEFTDLQSATRSSQIVYARHIAIYLARRITPKSLPEIGRVFGGRDHTTIIHAYEKIKRLRETDEQVRTHIETLMSIMDAE